MEKDGSHRVTSSSEARRINHINDLPLELIGLILSYLSFQERIAAGRCCKLWYSINRDIPWTSREKVILMRSDFNSNVLEVLENYGRRLRRIEFVEIHKELEQTWVEAVANYCPDVEEVGFRIKHGMDSAIVRNFADRCKNLLSFALHFDYPGQNGNEDYSFSLEELMTCPIAHLELKCIKGFNGSVLSSGNAALRSLNLESLPDMITFGPEWLCKCRNLEKLMLKDCIGVTQGDVFDTLAYAQANLKVLELVSLPKINLSSAYSGLGFCKNLSRIRLAGINLSTDVFANIAMYCRRLTEVEIRICDGDQITAYSMEFLALLPSLEYLFVSDFKRMSDGILYLCGSRSLRMCH